MIGLTGAASDSDEDWDELDSELAALDMAHNESIKALAVYQEPAARARYHNQEAGTAVAARGLTTR